MPPTISSPTSPSAVSARKSYILSVKPVDFSLTDGTNIPAPLDSPPITPVDKTPPPTSGGGPLTSHPTRQLMPGAFPGTFPPSPPAEAMHSSKHSTSSTGGASNHDRVDSLLQSPRSAHEPPTMPASPSGLRRPKGVRRIFSMSSLRQSFQSSRASPSQRLGSSYHDFNQNEESSVFSSQSPSGRPSSSMQLPPSTVQSQQANSTLRKKRSSNWFRRQSGFFTTNDEGMLDVVSEDTRDSKRMKGSQLPMLPEISTLVGDEQLEGSIGWDETMFKRW